MLAFLVAFLFRSKGRSLVYHADAWRQHLRALAYYGNWLRGNLYNLFVNHSFHIQSWTFGLGYGGDILTTLHYYCIGEPLTALSVFVPEKYTKYFFEFLILLRPYLAGLAFMLYTEYVLLLRRDSSIGTGTTLNDMRICGAKGDQKNNLSTGFDLNNTGCMFKICGALTYSFCGTVLYLGMLHPFFVTPMIWLPLLLLGLERILHEDRPALFMITVWLAALSNFYFFYMLAVLTAGYGIIRTAFIVPSMIPARARRGAFVRRYCATALKVLIYAAIGTAAAGCILIPVLVQFNHNPRSSTGFALNLFYDLSYYRELPENLITFINHPAYDTELCTSIMAVVAIILLFLMRGHRQLKAAVLGAAVMLMFPFFGKIMNGGSYVINRWTFAVEFLNCLILVIVFSDICEGRVRWIFKRKSKREASGIQKSTEQFRIRRRYPALLSGILIVVTLVINIISGGRSFPDEFIRHQSPDEYLAAAYTSEAAAVTAHHDESGDQGIDSGQPSISDSFWRYSGRDLTWNAALPLGTSSTQFEWSLADGEVSDFFQSVGNRDEQNFAYYALDDRTVLQALTGVRYYILSEYDISLQSGNSLYGYTNEGTVTADAGIPSEDKLTDEERRTVFQEDSKDPWNSGVDIYHVYENQFALPIAFTYDQVMSRENYDQLSMTERQETLLQAAVIDGTEGDESGQSEGNRGSDTSDNSGYALSEMITPQELNFSEEAVPFDIACGTGVQLIHNPDGSISFSVNQTGAEAILTFSGLTDSETYVVLEDLSVSGPETGGAAVNQNGPDSYYIEFTGWSGSEQMSDKTLRYLTPESQYYSDWHDFVINLGYSSTAKDKAVITFPGAGTYTMKSLRIVCQPMVPVMSNVAWRLQNTMDDPDLHQNPLSFATDGITGRITAAGAVSGQNRQFLMFNIPYSSGWTCLIDGQRSELQKADVMFMGTFIDAGAHEVTLRYRTPGSIAGNIISIIGLILMISIIIHRGKSRHQ